MKKKQLILTVSLIWIVLAVPISSYTVNLVYGQAAENAQGDLWGDNLGDQIMLWWSKQDGTSEYIVYRATSINGPWEEIFRATNIWGAQIDRTSDASLIDLCYKIEAYNQQAQLTRIYQPMCVPRYVP